MRWRAKPVICFRLSGSALHLIFHHFSTVSLLFKCCIAWWRRLPPKFALLCFVLTNSILLNLLSVCIVTRLHWFCYSNCSGGSWWARAFGVQLSADEKIGIARGNEDRKIMCVNLGTQACPLISQLFSTLICWLLKVYSYAWAQVLPITFETVFDFFNIFFWVCMYT